MREVNVDSWQGDADFAVRFLHQLSPPIGSLIPFAHAHNAGIFLALALRFDVARGKGIRYFWSAFGGYFAGITCTIAVMNYFQAAQVPLGLVVARNLWSLLNVVS